MSEPLSFRIGEYYTNKEIMTLGGGPMDFLPNKDGRVVAGRFTEKVNPRLPVALMVGDSDKRLKAAQIFRAQTEFIPIFIQPRRKPPGPRKWRYEGRFRVRNRVADPIKDAEEARFATLQWNPKPGVQVVLYLESEADITDQLLTEAASQANLDKAFDPQSTEDARDRVLAAIVRRRGQPEFRQKLLDAYGGRCAMSDCDCADALEAAHIRGYRGQQTNHVQNGLLLRADLHVLFDLHKISVSPTDLRIVISKDLKSTAYAWLEGKELRLPPSLSERPDLEVLWEHFSLCDSR